MADLLKAWIKKLLGVHSPSLHLMGYDYEFDYLMDYRKNKKGGNRDEDQNHRDIH